MAVELRSIELLIWVLHGGANRDMLDERDTQEHVLASVAFFLFLFLFLSPGDSWPLGMLGFPFLFPCSFARVVEVEPDHGCTVL